MPPPEGEVGGEAGDMDGWPAVGPGDVAAVRREPKRLVRPEIVEGDEEGWSRHGLLLGS